MRVYMYIEDDNLTIGLRSSQKFEGAIQDGSTYFLYHEVEFGQGKDVETLQIVPNENGWDIYNEGELYDKIEKGVNETSQFNINP